MSKTVTRWLAVSLLWSGQAMLGPGLLTAQDSDSESRIEFNTTDENVELRVAPSTENEPDEGLPGGTIRMPKTDADDVPAPPAVGQEKKAAESKAPTTENSEEPSKPTTGPATPPLSPEMAALRIKVRKAMAIYYPKHLNTRDNSPWEVMHGIIAYGVDAKLFRGASKGEEVNAIGWMCYNGACRGEQLFYLNNNEIVARRGPGLQGHYGQFLAIIAQSHVNRNYPMNINGRMFTLQDLITHEQADCQTGEELTFKLIGLMHYLDSDATWTNRMGQPWSIPRLVHEEIAQPIRGAACGGTHRLMGLSYAVNKRIQRGEPVDGEYRRAQQFINEYHRYTFSLQNSDGSFSTDWFVRRAADPNIDRRLRTHGHITEWLSFSLSENELQHPMMIKAVDYLAGILIDSPQHTWEIGPLGHGLHALRIYDRRMFKPLDGQPDAGPVATQPSQADKPTNGEAAQGSGTEDPTARTPQRRPLLSHSADSCIPNVNHHGRSRSTVTARRRPGSRSDLKPQASGLKPAAPGRKTGCRHGPNSLPCLGLAARQAFRRSACARQRRHGARICRA